MAQPLQILRTSATTAYQRHQIFKLWNAAYPESVTYIFPAQLDSYLDNLSDPEHYFLSDGQDTICGWAVTFTRQGAKWFAIIVGEVYRCMGWGALLLNALKNNEPVLNGWVIDSNRYVKLDGSLYQSPLGFYLKNDFEVLPDIRLETAQVSAVRIVWYR